MYNVHYTVHLRVHCPTKTKFAQMRQPLRFAYLADVKRFRVLETTMFSVQTTRRVNGFRVKPERLRMFHRAS